MYKHMIFLSKEEVEMCTSKLFHFLSICKEEVEVLSTCTCCPLNKEPPSVKEEGWNVVYTYMSYLQEGGSIVEHIIE